MQEESKNLEIALWRHIVIPLIGIISLVVMFAGGFWRMREIIGGRIVPPPAAFLSFFLGMGVSYLIYWKDPDATLWGNPGQLGALIEISLVTTVLFITLFLRGDLKEEFIAGTDQKLVGSLSIFVALAWWIFVTYTSVDEVLVTRISFVTTQVLMAGGYIGTVTRFLKMRKNHDSLFAWGCVFFSSLIAAGPAVAEDDLLSMINIARAIAASGITFGFLMGLDAANGRFSKEKTEEAVTAPAL